LRQRVRSYARGRLTIADNADWTRGLLQFSCPHALDLWSLDPNYSNRLRTAMVLDFELLYVIGGYMQFTRLCLFLPTYMFRSCWNIFLLFILQFFVSFEPFQHCNILFYETYGISDVVINRTFAILTKETRFIMANSMVCVVSEKNI
jgi:hypothetical protein